MHIEPKNYDWKVRGLFCLCEALRDAEEIHDCPEGADYDIWRDQRERARHQMNLALADWIQRAEISDEEAILPELRRAVDYHFSGQEAYRSKIRQSILEVLQQPVRGINYFTGKFHAWGYEAANLFWLELRTVYGRHASMVPVDFAIDHDSDMSFSPAASGRITFACRFLHPRCFSEPFDYYQWYLLTPFRFMHEYVSHVFPTAPEDSIFKEGWLTAAASCFLQSKLNEECGLSFARAHIYAITQDGVFSRLKGEAIDGAELAFKFWNLCSPDRLHHLMRFSANLAILPSDGDPRLPALGLARLQKIRRTKTENEIRRKVVEVFGETWGYVERQIELFGA